MWQVNFVITKLEKDIPQTSISTSVFHAPDEKHWDIAVKKALQIITSTSSTLTKV